MSAMGFPGILHITQLSDGCGQAAVSLGSRAIEAKISEHMDCKWSSNCGVRSAERSPRSIEASCRNRAAGRPIRGFHAVGHGGVGARDSWLPAARDLPYMVRSRQVLSTPASAWSSIVPEPKRSSKKAANGGYQTRPSQQHPMGRRPRRASGKPQLPSNLDPHHLKDASQFGRHSASKGGNFGVLGDDFEDLLARHRIAQPSAAPPSAAQSAVAAAAAAAVVERAAASLEGHVAGESQQCGSILEEAVRSGLAGPASPMAQRVRDLLASQAVAEATWHAVVRAGGSAAPERGRDETTPYENEGPALDAGRAASAVSAAEVHGRDAAHPATSSSNSEGGEGREPDRQREPQNSAAALRAADAEAGETTAFPQATPMEAPPPSESAPQPHSDEPPPPPPPPVVPAAPLRWSTAVASATHPGRGSRGSEDAFFVEGGWLGVADGIASWADHGVNSGLYSQQLMWNCVDVIRSSLDGSSSDSDFPSSPAAPHETKPAAPAMLPPPAGAACCVPLHTYDDLESFLHFHSCEEVAPKAVLLESHGRTEMQGTATATLASLCGQVLRVASIGDSGFLLLRRGAVLLSSLRQRHSFNCPFQIGQHVGDDPKLAMEYEAPVESGDVVLLATDGLFDNLFEEQIAAILTDTLQKGKSPQAAATRLVNIAQKFAESGDEETPFSVAAKAAGVTHHGGKKDDITVVLAVVE